MTIQQWQEKVHNLALESGWWIDHEEDRDLKPEARAAKHMLFVTEIAEATEEVRSSRKLPPIYQIWDQGPLHGKVMWVPGTTQWSDRLKPEGEAIELADAVIRIMDYFGFMGWDLEETIKLKHAFNLTRALRHGGKAI